MGRPWKWPFKGLFGLVELIQLQSAKRKRSTFFHRLMCCASFGPNEFPGSLPLQCRVARPGLAQFCGVVCSFNMQMSKNDKKMMLVWCVTQYIRYQGRMHVKTVDFDANLSQVNSFNNVGQWRVFTWMCWKKGVAVPSDGYSLHSFQGNYKLCGAQIQSISHHFFIFNFPYSTTRMLILSNSTLLNHVEHLCTKNYGGSPTSTRTDLPQIRREPDYNLPQSAGPMGLTFHFWRSNRWPKWEWKASKWESIRVAGPDFWDLGAGKMFPNVIQEKSKTHRWSRPNQEEHNSLDF